MMTNPLNTIPKFLSVLDQNEPHQQKFCQFPPGSCLAVHHWNMELIFYRYYCPHYLFENLHNKKQLHQLD